MSTSFAKKQLRQASQVARRLNKKRGQKQLHTAKPLVLGTTFTNRFDAFLAGMLHDIPGAAPIVKVVERLNPNDPTEVLVETQNIMKANHAEFFSGDPARKIIACEHTIDLLVLKLNELTLELRNLQRQYKLQVDENTDIGGEQVDVHLLRSAMFISGIFQDMRAGRRNFTTYFAERQISIAGGKGINFFQAEAQRHLGVAAHFQFLFQQRYRPREAQSVKTACEIIIEAVNERLNKIGGSIDYILDVKPDRRTKALGVLRTAALDNEENRELFNKVEATTDSKSHQEMIDTMITMVIEETHVDLIDEQKLPVKETNRSDGFPRSRDTAGQYIEERERDL